MGCVPSAAEKEAEKNSEAIDKNLAAEGLNRSNEIKLLLLGKFSGYTCSFVHRKNVCSYICIWPDYSSKLGCFEMHVFQLSCAGICGI